MKSINVSSGAAEGWEALTKDWVDCTACPISEYACKKVFGRGRVPAKVVLIGEGPGQTEDAAGYAFVGAAGRVLDFAVKELNGLDVSWFVTNLIACRPTDELNGRNRPPTDTEVGKCSARLQQTLDLVKPQAVVLLGRIPEKFLLASDYFKSRGLPILSAAHPAWIARQGSENAPQFASWKDRIVEFCQRVCK